MVEVYTSAEIDALVEGLERRLPRAMPDNVKAAARTVIEWLLAQLVEVTP